MADTERLQHVVVLMLENRSFDHILGGLGLVGAEGVQNALAIPRDPEQPGSPTVAVQPVTDVSDYVTDPDPGHEFEDVALQVFGKHHPSPLDPPTMTGFVASYAAQIGAGNQPIGPIAGQRIMRYFTPAFLTVTDRLAREFVVCDRWFSSVPGPTWPNRYYVHAGTSNGQVLMPTGLEALRQYILGFPDFHTIYEIVAAGGFTWNIYYHDSTLPWMFQSLRVYPERFVSFDQFPEDARNGHLPTYSFVEPCYFKPRPSDQHPPHDVRNGERLIASVYNALRSNETVWRNTLLIVLYDEHGGFFDHVRPPATFNPDGRNSAHPGFDFHRLGVRVPALLISPRVPKGRVDHTVYDHTSILRFMLDYFDLPGGRGALGTRAEHANSFESQFLPIAREDAPVDLAAEVDRIPQEVILAAAPVSLSAHAVSAGVLAEYVADQFPRQPAGQRLAEAAARLKQAVEAP